MPAFLPDLNGRRTNRPQSRFAITAASDTPFLPADLVDRLCSASGEGAPNLAVARSADGLHPVFGLWPMTLAPDLEASLMSGERKVSDWVRQHQAREVMFPPLEIGSRTIDPFSISTGRTIWLRPKRFSRQAPSDPRVRIGLNTMSGLTLRPLGSDAEHGAGNRPWAFADRAAVIA